MADATQAETEALLPRGEWKTKPVPGFSAYQFFENPMKAIDGAPGWIIDAMFADKIVRWDESFRALAVQTIEYGWRRADKGDWVVRDFQGHLSVYNKDTFEIVFERADLPQRSFDRDAVIEECAQRLDAWGDMYGRAAAKDIREMKGA